MSYRTGIFCWIFGPIASSLSLSPLNLLFLVGTRDGHTYLKGLVRVTETGQCAWRPVAVKPRAAVQIDWRGGRTSGGSRAPPEGAAPRLACKHTGFLFHGLARSSSDSHALRQIRTLPTYKTQDTPFGTAAGCLPIRLKSDTSHSEPFVHKPHPFVSRSRCGPSPGPGMLGVQPSDTLLVSSCQMHF